MTIGTCVFLLSMCTIGAIDAVRPISAANPQFQSIIENVTAWARAVEARDIEKLVQFAEREQRDGVRRLLQDRNSYLYRTMFTNRGSVREVVARTPATGIQAFEEVRTCSVVIGLLMKMAYGSRMTSD